MNMRDSEKALYGHFDRKRDVDAYRYHNNGRIQFGSVDSQNFNVWVTDIRVADSPKRDVSFLSIPGRNGDLIVDNNRWSNVDITYSFAIPTAFADRFDDFKMALLSANRYQRLEDSFYPDVFRMAIVKDPIQPKVMRNNRTGIFDVTFTSKPQRFLKSGEFTVPLKADGVIFNPTLFPALPLIHVHGAGDGALRIGDIEVQINAMADDIYLDCELMDAYHLTDAGALESRNGIIYAPEFPVLLPGENIVDRSGGVTVIEIIPRWWTL